MKERVIDRESYTHKKIQREGKRERQREKDRNRERHIYVCRVGVLDWESLVTGGPCGSLRCTPSV